MLFSYIRLCKSKDHVIWIDNWNNDYAVATQRINSGSYRACNWTGVAIKSIDEKFNTDLKWLPDKPACPVSINDHQVWRLIMHEIVAFGDQHQGSVWNHALVCINNVRCVPCKIEGTVLGMDVPDVLPGESMTGMDTFFPDEIRPANIASNTVLLRYMRHIHDTWNVAGDSLRYVVVLADCNIYYRILKVLLWF